MRITVIDSSFFIQMKTLPQEISIKLGAEAQEFIPPQVKTDEKEIIDDLIVRVG